MTEHDHTWELLQRLNAKVDTLQNTVTAYMADQKAVCMAQRERSREVYLEVFGNGKPGIKQVVAELKAADEFRRNSSAAAVGLILTNIGTIITFSVTIIKNL